MFLRNKFLLPLMARSHLLCPERQSKQNALLCHRSERSHNHRHSLFELIFSLPFLLTLFRCFQSVLIGDYSISTLCFSGALFRTSLFKTALFYCDRYFLLLPRFLLFALLSASIYSLLAPVVAMRCFGKRFGVVWLNSLSLMLRIRQLPLRGSQADDGLSLEQTLASL